MAIDLDVVEKVTGHAGFLNKLGGTVVVVPADVAATWTSSNPLLLALAPTPDGLNCLCTPTGEAGAVTVTVSGTFKGTPLTPFSADFVLTSKVPVAFTLTFDPPVLQ